MKKTVLITMAVVLGMQLAMGQGFKNPVLPGFHADPSVCRAGNDFYLVNSTFQYFPGVPVFHSKDLIHWEQVGNCLTRPSQVDLKGTDGNSGIYAPTIRYHNGRFYMVTTVFPSRRHFYVWTDNPAGEWSEPIVIDFAIGSCDPTLFWDDSKCYFLWKEGDIKICEIDVKTGKQLGEIHHLGTGLGGRYPEGPHIYKKDGYYYLLLAEGGTEHGHHVNILRSRSLFGPYEPNPANPILSHFNMKMQNSQIQGLGHADLIQAPDDSWWMICLGYRTSGYLQHVMGRETMLAPVQWEQGGWPVVNGNGTLQIDMQCQTLPQVPMAQDPVREKFNYVKRNVPATSYHSLGLPMGWMSLCTPDYSKYSLTERKGYLRLHPSTIDLSETASPTFVARRQTELNFTATSLLDLSHLTEGMQAGITAYAAPLNHYDVVVERRGGKLYVKSNVRLGQTAHSEQEIQLNGSRAYLRITSDKEFYYMQASSDGANYTTLAKMEYRFLSTETIGGFTGVMLGLFAQSKEQTKGYVDIDWFEYNTATSGDIQQAKAATSSNLFSTLLGKSETEVQSRINSVWTHFFTPSDICKYDADGEKCVYYEVGDSMGIIVDTGSNDVRTEGMSYGMMISVQMDKREVFDKLWRWAKTYMTYPADSPWDGYFCWQCSLDGKQIGQSNASDGEIYFVTALFLAAEKWGEPQYAADANEILHKVTSKDGKATGVYNLYDESTRLITFVPNEEVHWYSDPSYCLPAFLELWAEKADAKNDFWREAADKARWLLEASQDSATGLYPDYSLFDGKPYRRPNFGYNTDRYQYDAIRCPMNVGMDYYLTGKAKDAQRTMMRRLLRFFKNEGFNGGQFNLDGTEPTGNYTEGMAGANAVGAFALADSDNEEDRALAREYVQRLWDVQPPTGKWRYYVGMVYFLSMLHVSGNFSL